MTSVVSEARSPLRYINRILICLIIAINLYVLVTPFIPQLQLWLRKRQWHGISGVPYKTKLSNGTSAKGIPSDNRLVIPKLAMDTHIYTGKDPYLVNKGAWARPNTSTPPKGSNTVIVGHRFTYDGPATFYSLDKVKPNDSIIVYWQKKEYDYIVTKTEVVPPTAVQVEKLTKDAQLTLYTCTPIWSAKNRLVVYAKPVDAQ
jgi:sortase A